MAIAILNGVSFPFTNILSVVAFHFLLKESNNLAKDSPNAVLLVIVKCSASAFKAVVPLWYGVEVSSTVSSSIWQSQYVIWKYNGIFEIYISKWLQLVALKAHNLLENR
jgi:hypothetical protein